jgi:GNAT superfamily N-acetyltransferase
MNTENFKLTQISTSTKFKPFNCSDDDLNGFLFEDAKNYNESLMAVTYIIEDIKLDNTVAYYSLLADKIYFDPEDKSSWNKINRTIPNSKRRKSYPAIKIGRLAVSKEYSGKGIGTMIIDSIMHLFTHSRRIGCRFVTVDALQSAIPFYTKCGFKFFTDKDSTDPTRLMFFELTKFII